MTKIAAALALLCTCLCTTSLAQEIYKWTDDDGNVHYGDRPTGEDPESAVVIAVESRRTRPELVQSEIDSLRERREARDEAEAEAAEAEAEAAEARREAEEQAEQCTAYRARLQKFAQARRLYRTDENGERVYLDEAQMQQTRADLQARIEELCNG